MTRAETLWLARARDAVRQGQTEHDFVCSAPTGSFCEAVRAYAEALRESETRQAFISELTTL